MLFSDEFRPKILANRVTLRIRKSDFRFDGKLSSFPSLHIHEANLASLTWKVGALQYIKYFSVYYPLVDQKPCDTGALYKSSTWRATCYIYFENTWAISVGP